jgi:hypothetical protein
VYQPSYDDDDDDDDECGAVSGMLGRGNRSARRKIKSLNIASVYTTSPTIPEAAAVGSLRLPPEVWHGSL